MTSRMRNTLPFLILMLFCLAAFPSCGQETPQVQRSAVLMDTVITIRASGEQAEPAVEASMKRLEELDRMLSEEYPGSAVNELNKAAGREYVRVPDEVWHILKISQKYSTLTDGAWDITLGKPIALWGIGTDHPRIPSDEDLDNARKSCGWQHLTLREEDQSVLLEQEGMAIHFGGIAKGYALDEIQKIFQAHGVENGLIDMGASSLCALGKNEKGTPWIIGIRHPRSEKSLLAKLPLTNQMLSTSGDYERFFEEDGQRYHHILDPRTCRPADNGLTSVTVVISNSMEDAGMISDLLSTAVFVMGPRIGKDFLEQCPDGISAELTTADGKIMTVHGMKLQEISKDYRL